MNPLCRGTRHERAQQSSRRQRSRARYCDLECRVFSSTLRDRLGWLQKRRKRNAAFTSSRGCDWKADEGCRPHEKRIVRRRSGAITREVRKPRFSIFSGKRVLEDESMGCGPARFVDVPAIFLGRIKAEGGRSSKLCRDPKRFVVKRLAVGDYFSCFCRDIDRLRDVQPTTRRDQER